MSWSTPKLPPSESKKGLLSSPKTLFGTPSTVNNQDRTGQSPEVEHRHDRTGSFGMVETDDVGRSMSRSRFSTFASSKRVGPNEPPANNWENDLDRDQVLQPDYGRAKHISSMFQTNPMLNLYSDATANATASTRMPFDSPSSPPHLPGSIARTPRRDGGGGGLGEEDEIDLRPPPSVHDPYVAAQKTSAEQLRKRLEQERNASAAPQEVEMNSSIAMQEQLAKIFDLQMQLADMHGEMEGINEIVRDEDLEDGQHDKKDEASRKEDLTRSPKTPVTSPKSKAGRAALSPKSPAKDLDNKKNKEQDKEEVDQTEAPDRPGMRREQQIGDIVAKASPSQLCVEDKSS